jgi:hypothetical protein
MTLRIERYRNTRHWAVYEGETLVVVTVYKRGAQELLRRLAAQPRATAEAAARPASWAAPPRPPPGQAGRRRAERECHRCWAAP